MGQQLNINTIGLIRGNELSKNSNPFLKQISEWGMKLYFLDRENYRKKVIPKEIALENVLIIPEGGFSELGVIGVECLINEMNEQIKAEYIITAVGTGTTAIGLSQYSKMKTIGILTLNNKNEIESNFKQLGIEKYLAINENYIFGKYAKESNVLTEFCKSFHTKHGIMIEPIYTGRMFYGLCDLIRQNYFPENSKIIALHTGGVKLSD